MKNYILILFVSLLFYRCSPARYVHSPLVISGLEEKGNYAISGSFSSTTDTKNFTINGGYVVSNHIIIQSSYTYRDDYSKKVFNYKTDGNALDIAFGYTNNKKEKRFYVESFLGYGVGNVNNTSIEEVNSYANFKYNKVFSQVNLNFDTNSTKSNYLSLHFPVRIEYLHYAKIAFNNFNSNFGQNSLTYLSENPTLLVFSIGKTLSYNLENVTFSLFRSYHSPTTAMSFFTFVNFYAGFGVTWRNFFF